MNVPRCPCGLVQPEVEEFGFTLSDREQGRKWIMVRGPIRLDRESENSKLKAGEVLQIESRTLVLLRSIA